MAALELGQEERKRARPDLSEHSPLSAKSPGQSQAAKKVCLAMDAVEKEIVPMKEVTSGEDDDNCKCIHDIASIQLDVAQPMYAGMPYTEAAPDDGHTHIDILQPVCAGKASNEADPIVENKATFAHTVNDSKKATVGPRCFSSPMDMLDFFYCLLHGWPLNLNINKYEHMMLEDLLKKGHREWQEKVGTGIKAFQVRINREFASRCFYVIRRDGSTKDFSYRKCVDNLLPLPKLLKPHLSTSNQKEKGSNSQLNTKVSEARGPKTQCYSKGRGMMERGVNGKANHHGHGIGNSRRGNRDRKGMK